MKYIEQYKRWYCYPCKSYAPTSYQPPSVAAVAVEAAQPASTATAATEGGW